MSLCALAFPFVIEPDLQGLIDSKYVLLAVGDRTLDMLNWYGHYASVKIAQGRCPMELFNGGNALVYSSSTSQNYEKDRASLIRDRRG